MQDIDVFPGDLVETLGAQTGLVVSIELSGYASVMLPELRIRVFYGGYLKVLSRMPEVAGLALASTYSLGGIEAVESLAESTDDGEPFQSVRLLTVAHVMHR